MTAQSNGGFRIKADAVQSEVARYAEYKAWCLTRQLPPASFENWVFTSRGIREWWGEVLK